MSKHPASGSDKRLPDAHLTELADECLDKAVGGNGKKGVGGEKPTEYLVVTMSNTQISSY